MQAWAAVRHTALARKVEHVADVLVPGCRADVRGVCADDVRRRVEAREVPRVAEIVEDRSGSCSEDDSDVSLHTGSSDRGQLLTLGEFSRHEVREVVAADVGRPAAVVRGRGGLGRRAGRRRRRAVVVVTDQAAAGEQQHGGCQDGDQPPGLGGALGHDDPSLSWLCFGSCFVDHLGLFRSFSRFGFLHDGVSS